jgi:high-affinity K+ transport system ATPase subunit B
MRLGRGIAGKWEQGQLAQERKGHALRALRPAWLVIAITARLTVWVNHRWRHRGAAMQTLLMALLALIVCGAIGTLLTMVVIAERWEQARATKRKSAHASTTLWPPL